MNHIIVLAGARKMIFKFKGTDVHCRELTTGCLDKKITKNMFLLWEENK